MTRDARIGRVDPEHVLDPKAAPDGGQPRHFVREAVVLGGEGGRNHPAGGHAGENPRRKTRKARGDVPEKADLIRRTCTTAAEDERQRRFASCGRVHVVSHSGHRSSHQQNHGSTAGRMSHAVTGAAGAVLWAFLLPATAAAQTVGVVPGGRRLDGAGTHRAGLRAVRGRRRIARAVGVQPSAGRHAALRVRRARPALRRRLPVASPVLAPLFGVSRRSLLFTAGFIYYLLPIPGLDLRRADPRAWLARRAQTTLAGHDPFRGRLHRVQPGGRHAASRRSASTASSSSA